MKVNRIDRLRPAAPIARMPEQEIAFLKEEMRQRAELEEENQRRQEQPPEPPTPEEQAQRKAERVLDGAAREAAIRPNDPSATPVLSISDLFQAAKSAGLHSDEITCIQVRLKTLKPQDRTQEMRFLQDKVLKSRNWAQALRTYSEISLLHGRYPERLTPQIVQALAAGIIERPAGKMKIPSVVMQHQEALEAALLIPQLGQVEYEQICILMKDAGLRSGKKIREADGDVERAFILKAAALRSQLFLNPDALNKLRILVGLPIDAVRELEIFASRIRCVPANDLIDFANKPVTLVSEEPISNDLELSKHSKNYLVDGFFDSNQNLKPELVTVWSQNVASLLTEESVSREEVFEMVEQLAHVAVQFEKRFGNDPGKTLDPATRAAIKLILASENAMQSPSLWELSDSAQRLLVDFRSLAALIVHLDAIRENM